MTVLNPNNPYVLNEHYFASYANKTVYKETSIYAFRLVTSSILFAICVFLSCLLFYLIFNQTPQNFKPYRKMLILMCVMDSYTSIIYFITQARMRIVDGLIVYTFDGLISLFGFSSFCPCVFLLNSNQYMGCGVIPVQYLYRYWLIVRNEQLTTFQILGYSTISVSLGWIFGLNAANMACLGTINPDAIGYEKYWFEEDPIPLLLVASTKHQAYAFQQVYGAVVVTVYYSICIVLAFMTIREMKKKLDSVNVKASTKRAQRQIGYILYAQLIIPLVTVILPRFITPVFIILYIPSKYAADYISFSYTCFPLFTMISTILLIAPFRRFCLQFVPCSENYRWKTTTIANPRTTVIHFSATAS